MIIIMMSQHKSRIKPHKSSNAFGTYAVVQDCPLDNLSDLEEQFIFVDPIGVNILSSLNALISIAYSI